MTLRIPSHKSGASMNKKLHGRGGPGRNQGRKPNATKGLPAGRTLAITIKVSPDVKALLQRRADESGESLSTYCAAVLDWHAAMKAK